MKSGFHGKGFFGADEKEIDNKGKLYCGSVKGWEVPAEEDVAFPTAALPCKQWLFQNGTNELSATAIKANCIFCVNPKSISSHC